jgi:hypothetical protein
MGLGSSGSSQLSGPLAMAGTTQDLALAYDTSSGSFRPPPAPPKSNQKPASAARRLQQALQKSAMTNELQALLKNMDENAGIEEGIKRHFR